MKGLVGVSSLGPPANQEASLGFFFWTSSYAIWMIFQQTNRGASQKLFLHLCKHQDTSGRIERLQVMVLVQWRGRHNTWHLTILWGWTSLDRLWRLVLGEVTVVTGIPGHGKSEFLLSLAVSWWSLGGNIGIQENWGWKHLVMKGPLFTNKSTGMSQEFWTLL